MGSLWKYALEPRGPIPYPHAKFQPRTSKHGERHSRTDIHTYSIILVILEHLQLHNALQHWLHLMALCISKLIYLWLTPADPCKIFNPINALHSGLGRFYQYLVATSARFWLKKLLHRCMQLTIFTCTTLLVHAQKRALIKKTLHK